MYNTNNNFTTAISCIIGLAGIGYAMFTHNKMAKISAKLDKGIDELADNVDVDISEEMIKKAVEKAVAEETKRAVTKATNDIMYEAKEDIRVSVAAAVNTEYARIQESVLKEITASAARIDVDKVRRDVEKAAEEAALKKFDANLDDVLKRFNANLDKTDRVYDVIRTMMTPNTNLNREFILKLG